MRRLPLTELFRLRDFVSERYGFFVADDKLDLLGSRVEARLEQTGMASAAEYYRHLRFGADAEAEVQSFVESLTINETYFFRDRHQLDALFDLPMTTMVSGRADTNRRALTFLSAACSTGEEAYTLQIMAREMLRMDSSWSINVTGVDLHLGALVAAKAGIYSRRQVKDVPATVLERYFSVEGQRFKIAEEIRRKVNFEHGNLVDVEFYAAHTAQFDVVLCRNVLIYFPENVIARVLASIHSVLRPDGLLVLGHAETIARVPVGFRAERYGGATFFRKT